MHCSLTVLALIFFMVAIVSQYSYPQWLHAASKIVSGFPHHIIMHSNTLRWYNSCLMHLSVCCNRESMEWVLEFLEMVSTDDLKGA